ncbi:MAG: putative lipid II flippase FtsW [Candidatus Omnitrophica bacterium]|nr:putative lipid II flippase FtsW [Candidatus Omnitrophota bacterium]MDE2221872.1 putative lipid II flippase FtsW [Candidatus Omnitrophota bacterium]
MRQERINLSITVLTLICFGIIMIYSASCVNAMQTFGDSMYFLKRHLLFLTLGLVASFFIMRMDYRRIQPFARPLIGLCVLLLIFVLIPHIGNESYGARRWFKLGVFHFQPSELAKLALIIYTADFLHRKQHLVRSFRYGFLPPLIVMGILCALTVKQPDLGTTVEMAVVTLTMLFLGGARLWHLGLVFGSAVPVLVYLIVKEPYRMARIIAFLDPWQDSQGIGFQLTQSQIALGSGGLFGVGLGHSKQKLFYLPAAHTDFILSIIGEELGLIGTLTVITLFCLFIWQGTRIVRQTNNAFGYFLGMGIVMMLGLQAMVNVGVSIGAFPTKGLPLPFISYGGSALIFHLAAIALLLNISKVEDY